MMTKNEKVELIKKLVGAIMEAEQKENSTGHFFLEYDGFTNTLDVDFYDAPTKDDSVINPILTAKLSEEFSYAPMLGGNVKIQTDRTIEDAITAVGRIAFNSEVTQ